MLTSLARVLGRAKRHRYAVGAFNVSNLETAQAVLRAATALRAPVIVNVTEKAIAFGGLEPLAAIVKSLAVSLRIPVVLNLDHGRTVAMARRCLKAGFTGIMLDASRHTYAVNVRWTHTVVRAAKRYGAGTEGELGVVAYDGEHVALTDPKQAADFVQRTGVAAFAVGIGNRHGPPTPGERLDLKLLARIRARVKVPLVLHGASGTAPAIERRAIALGVCKFNIDTDLRRAFTETLRASLKRNRSLDPRVHLAAARDTVQRVVASKIRAFGSAHRG